MTFFRTVICLTLACILIAPRLLAEEGAEAAPAPAAEGKESASAEGGEGEHKKKAPEKPKPDSAVSTVLALPEVKKWQTWMEAHGHTIEAWGITKRDVAGAPCYEVGVGERDGDHVQHWAYFCLMQFGLETYVESQDESTGETNFYTYEKWRSKCQPTDNSPGKC